MDHILTMATSYMTKHQQNLEERQYILALVRITGTIRGTYKEQLYQKLGLESLKKKDNGYQKLRYFYKIFNKQSLKYLLLCLVDHTAKDTWKISPSFKVRLYLSDCKRN